MSQNSSVAASLNPEQRKQLFIEMQSSAQTITAIAKREGVSRSFLYKQQQKGNQALELGFNQQKDESDILYWIPVTKNWIFQLRDFDRKNHPMIRQHPKRYQRTISRDRAVLPVLDLTSVEPELQICPFLWA